MNAPFAADLRTAMARAVMRHATGFVALVAPWLAVPSDRRMSRLTLAAIAGVLALGLGCTGWVAVEAVSFAAHRMQRQEDVQ